MPRSDESAGKRRSTKLRKGAPWLKTLLVQTAWCAVRVKPKFNSHDKRSVSKALNFLAAASQKAPFPLKCGATSAHVFLCAEWDRVATVAARTMSGPTRPDISSRAKRAAHLEFAVQPVNQRIFQHPPGCGATRGDFP